MPKVLIASVAIAAAGALIWNLQRGEAVGLGSQGKPLPMAAGETASSPAESVERVGSGLSGATESSTERPAMTTANPPDRGASALSGKEIAALGMTRQLAGEHRLQMDGRVHRVLGSKEVVDQAGKSETMLLIRDELSGQISYRLSGLQFTLKDGVDYEAFIREHRSMRRLFVNPLYAQVAVDAGDIAEQFSALARDARVARLRFMTREPVIKPK
jgi:hypothetical protein